MIGLGAGESATVATIRSLIRELESGERTTGNIDVTMQSVEVQFGLVEPACPHTDPVEQCDEESGL